MRRSFSFHALGVMAGAAMALSLLGAVTPASAATLAATTTCANDTDNTGGLGVICEVTIVNTITASGGSAEVTVRECHGAAGDPTADCTVDTQVLSEPVTSVQQCNAAMNGGGGTLRCSVRITNLFAQDPNPGAVTVNQCVGSGDGDGSGCDPFPATTTGATITQCNGTANGGTLVELTCTASGTQSSALDVTVNQCNGSTNGGGFLVICSAEIVNRQDDTLPTAAPTAAPTASPAGSPAATTGPEATASPNGTSNVEAATGNVDNGTLPPTDTASPAMTASTSPSTLPIVLIGLAAAIGLLATTRRPLRR